MGAETKVVINGPQGERRSWEKEYLDSGKQCLKGLKKQLDLRSSWEREREQLGLRRRRQAGWGQ